MRKRYSNEQIAFALRQVESGTSVLEVCRRIWGIRADVRHAGRTDTHGLPAAARRAFRRPVSSLPRATQARPNQIGLLHARSRSFCTARR